MSPDAKKKNASQAVRPASDVNELNDAEIERYMGLGRDCLQAMRSPCCEMLPLDVGSPGAGPSKLLHKRTGTIGTPM
jgi:hypothetical protein